MTRILSALSITYVVLLPIGLLKIGSKVILADLVFALLAILWLFSIVLRKVRPPSRAAILIPGAIVLANILSFLNSVDMKGSVFDFAGAIYLILIFVIFASILRSDAGLFSKIIKTVYTMAIIVSLIGISAILGYRLFGIKGFLQLLLISSTRTSVVSFARVGSTLVMPEMLINFSILGLASAMIIWYEKKNSFKMAASIRLSALIIILANLLAYSRSLAGFFITGAAGSLMTRAKDRFSKFIMPAFCFLAAGFLFMSVVTSIWSVYPLFFKFDNGHGKIEIKINKTPDIRIMLKDAALRITARHPLFGIGQSSFSGNFIDYIDREKYKETLALSGITSERPQIDPHSSYFGALAETGLFGFGAIAALIIYLIISSVRSFAGSSKNDIVIAQKWLFAALIGYLLNAIYVDVFSMRFFWLTLSLLYYTNEEIMRA